MHPEIGSHGVGGPQLDGMHDGCARALFTVTVARMAGAVYAAAFKKWRRARSSSFESPTACGLGPNPPLRSSRRRSSSSELCCARVRNCRPKYLLTTVAPNLYRRTVDG